MRRDGQLDYQFGTGFHDEVVHHIGASLLQVLRRPSEANQLFVDHAMLALSAHVAQSYGGLQRSTELARGGLAPWQAKRACEKLESDLGQLFDEPSKRLRRGRSAHRDRLGGQRPLSTRPSVRSRPASRSRRRDLVAVRTTP